MIRLIVQDQELLDALASPEGFAERYGAEVGGQLELARGVVADTLGFLDTVGARPPWIGYLCVATDARQVIGCGSFKGGPDQDDEVEIAYYTFPDFEGRGYATATARALVGIARQASGARAVIAYTLAEPNASTRILGKLGFEHLGQVDHPEDGPVWHWRLAL